MKSRYKFKLEKYYENRIKSMTKNEALNYLNDLMWSKHDTMFIFNKILIVYIIHRLIKTEADSFIMIGIAILQGSEVMYKLWVKTFISKLITKVNNDNFKK